MDEACSHARRLSATTLSFDVPHRHLLSGLARRYLHPGGWVMTEMERVHVAGPLVVFEVPARVDAHTLGRIFEVFERVFERDSKFASVVDLAGGSVPGAAERRQVAAWLERVAARQKRLNVGSAHVVRSAAVRGALTAIHWMFPAPTPQVYVGDREAAFDYCFERLAAEGIAIPEEAHALRARFGRENVAVPQKRAP